MASVMRVNAYVRSLNSALTELGSIVYFQMFTLTILVESVKR